MKADTKTETKVIAVLNKAHDAYSRRDIEGLLACFLPDADVVMFGTGADEKRVGSGQIKMQAERDWSQTEAGSIQLGWYSVSAADSVAWVATDAIFNVRTGGQEMSVPARLTCVLEKRGDTWLIGQAHYSIPWGEQAEGESFPT